MELKNLELPSNKKFGFFFTVVFVILGLLAFRTQLVVFGALFSALSLTTFIITLTAPNILSPINKLWMSVGIFIGKIVNPIVLGLIFFGLFTPFGLVAKLFKRDELRLKVKVNDTFWQKRDIQYQQSSSFKNLF